MSTKPQSATRITPARREVEALVALAHTGIAFVSNVTDYPKHCPTVNGAVHWLAAEWLVGSGLASLAHDPRGETLHITPAGVEAFNRLGLQLEFASE